MENEKNELLEAVENRLAAMEEQEQKRSRRIFIAVLVSILLLTALSVFLTVKVSALMSEVKVFTEAAEAIDMEAAAAKVNELAAMDTTGLQKLSDYLAGMDEAELAHRMDGLQDALDILSKLDIDSFSKSLSDLTEMLEPLMRLFGSRG